jgi:hypothetical protein
MLTEDQTTLCPNCDQNIENSKYFLHERMCSLNVKKCPKCNTPFNIDDLSDHIKQVHSYIICDLCNNKFPNGEIEEHKRNCLYQLVPCRYCELNVLLKELEEHENVCGSTTKKCPKCGLYIEIKKYDNHLCLNKESEYYNENIIINKKEDEKIEKKKIKLENNYYKKNKVFNKNDENTKKNKNIIKNEKLEKNELNDNKDNKKKFGQKKGKNKKAKINNDNKEINEDDLDLNMFYTPEELQDQVNALNTFEEINNKNNENIIINDDKQKKKKKKKKWKDLDEKESEKQAEIKTKKGKKIKNANFGGKKVNNNKLDKKKEDDKYYDEDEYVTVKKNNDLHNIKWDIPPEKFKNYNKVDDINYGFEYNLEENMLQEAIKRSLMEK